ncbi:MAG: PmoA family protein [Thermoproteota archaeon]
MARKLLVKAGHHDRVDCPVSIDIELPQGAAAVKILDQGSGKEVPCQTDIVEGRRARLTWIENMRKGQEKEYKLDFRPEESFPASVTLREGVGEVDFLVMGRLFTTYHFSQDLARPYLHPVIGPYGKPVTRGFPMVPDDPKEVKDHPHHRSIWVAHGDVNGVDNWSEEKGHGRTVHRGFLAKRSGAVLSELVALSDWVSSDGRAVLTERRTMRVYNASEDRRILDISVELSPVLEEVAFGDTKEGGIISVRVASSMDVERGGKIQNSYGGVNEAETWGKRAHWCDYSGQVDGHLVGIAVFDHAGNFRHPTYWHVRDYGLMTANPFGISYFTNDPLNKGTFVLRNNSKLVFKYRLLIHKGDAEEGRVAERYLDYAYPPSASLA